MADIRINKAHKLPLKKAKEVAQQVADQLKEKYDLKSEWVGDVLKFYKSGIKGELSVTGKEIDVHISLGFLLNAFRHKIQSEIERNMDDMFG